MKIYRSIHLFILRERERKFGAIECLKAIRLEKGWICSIDARCTYVLGLSAEKTCVPWCTMHGDALYINGDEMSV